MTKMEQKRSVQYLATFAVALASATSSASFSWTIPVIPKFHSQETDISLTDAEISWVVAVVSPGVLISCIISRFTSDRFGRRTTLLGTAIPFVVGTILVVTARTAWQLCLARICWGLGSGAIAPVVAVYVSEIASKEIRGSLSVMVRFMFTFGTFLVITVGTVTSYQTLSFLIVALALCYFAAIWWAPESPYFLIKEGKIAPAKKALEKLNGFKDEKILEEKISEMRVHVREEMKNSGTLKELLTGNQYRKAILISIGLRSTQIMSGLIPLGQYVGRILQDTNSNISVSMGMIIFAALRFIISIMASVIVDKVGRRPLLIFSYTGAALVLACNGIIFFFHEVLNKTPPYFGYVTLFNLMLLSTVSLSGYESVNFVIPPEIFPINVKSTALTYLNVWGTILTFANVKCFQMLKDYTGLRGVFFIYASFALCGAIFSYIVVPETKGKSLREIQIELQGEMHSEVTDKANKGNEEDEDDIELRNTSLVENDPIISSKV